MSARWLGGLVSGCAVAALMVAACGSDAGSEFGPPVPEAGTSSSSSSGFIPQNDGGNEGGPKGKCARTCEELKINCGPAGDGCGNLIQCGTCNAPDTCGGGGTPSVCGGGKNNCVPKTCADFPANSCGPVADGCGGLLNCGANNGTCTPPQTCGGGGQPSVCGGNTGCVPKTVADCAAQGVNCGPIADGCGGSVNCGTCGANEACGTGGGPGKCGPAGGGNCTPKTCAQLNFNCGPAGNGCGGMLDCGTCTAPQSCGGGGQPSRCGGTSACVPKTCAQVGATCGPAGDGCGGTIQCGTCNPPQSCGGGGTPSTCGGNNVCIPKTCANYPANSCGPQADGCGGVLTNCGVGDPVNCPAPSICGGGGTPGVCGGGGPPPPPPCNPGQLCNNVQPCNGAGQVKTTITGTVVSPRTCQGAVCNSKTIATDADPIPNVLVFIPNNGLADVKAFGANVSCDQCGGAGQQQNILVKATTGADGKFTLTDVPVGNNVPIVIQIGRWRRVFQRNITTSCGANNLGDLHLPKNKTEGDIPHTAIATGGVDTLECVLRKIGIEDSEFTSPTGTGRIKIYQGDDGPEGMGHRPPSGTGGTQSWSNLYGSATELAKYDQLIFDCNGDPGEASMDNGDRDRLRDYLGLGGRLFATHYQYVWLNNYSPFSTTATWNVDQNGRDAITGNIDTSFPKGLLFGSWLDKVNALSNVTPPRITINVSRHDMDPLPNPPGTGIASSAQRWISVHNTLPNGNAFGNSYPNYVGAPQHYTFNTPVGAAPEAQCGRVLFSDFHVANASVDNARFPDGCGSRTAALTPQEKVIEFMLFDLGSCIAPDVPPPPPQCTPRTCAQAGANCGSINNGCGGVLNCGTCNPPQTCGGGGTPNVCGGVGCTPRTCAQANANCGPVGDGCGGQIDCGPCVPPQTCGGGGIPSQCGNPACIATTCAAQGFNCGPAGNGCGGQLNCGTCEPPDTCGGGGSPGVCGNSTCKPMTCAQVGATCGPIGDGCGGLVGCGTCPPGQVCGGGGPSKCGAGTCNPRTCAQAGANCGPIGDGCGGVIQCGPCTMPGQSCGGAGVPNQCGGCTRKTCQQLGVECGPAGDGCGGQLDCGGCNPPDSCGGGGVAFKCGRPQVN